METHTLIFNEIFDHMYDQHLANARNDSSHRWGLRSALRRRKSRRLHNPHRTAGVSTSSGKLVEESAGKMHRLKDNILSSLVALRRAAYNVSAVNINAEVQAQSTELVKKLGSGSTSTRSSRFAAAVEEGNAVGHIADLTDSETEEPGHHPRQAAYDSSKGGPPAAKPPSPKKASMRLQSTISEMQAPEQKNSNLPEAIVSWECPDPPPPPTDSTEVFSETSSSIHLTNDLEPQLGTALGTGLGTSPSTATFQAASPFDRYDEEELLRVYGIRQYDSVAEDSHSQLDPDSRAPSVDSPCELANSPSDRHEKAAETQTRAPIQDEVARVSGSLSSPVLLGRNKSNLRPGLEKRTSRPKITM